MRKLLTIIALTAAFLPIGAQNVSRMLVDAPDSILPYLNRAQRIELLALKALDPSEASVVRNLFATETKLTDVTEVRLTLFPCPGTEIELQRLPSADGDSLYCMLKTIAMPERETSCYIYNKEWKELKRYDFQEVSLTQKPDTMATEKYQELLSMVEFPIVEAHFDVEPAVVELSLNVPLLFKGDAERLAAILVKRKLRWDGRTF